MGPREAESPSFHAASHVAADSSSQFRDAFLAYDNINKWRCDFSTTFEVSRSRRASCKCAFALYISPRIQLKRARNPGRRRSNLCIPFRTCAGLAYSLLNLLMPLHQ